MKQNLRRVTAIIPGMLKLSSGGLRALRTVAFYPRQAKDIAPDQ